MNIDAGFAVFLYTVWVAPNDFPEQYLSEEFFTIPHKHFKKAKIL